MIVGWSLNGMIAKWRLIRSSSFLGAQADAQIESSTASLFPLRTNNIGFVSVVPPRPVSHLRMILLQTTDKLPTTLSSPLTVLTHKNHVCPLIDRKFFRSFLRISLHYLQIDFAPRSFSPCYLLLKITLDRTIFQASCKN